VSTPAVTSPPASTPPPATARPRPLRARKLALIARPEACTACGACVESCPRGAVEVGDVAAVDATLCIGCGVCIDACPNDVIEIETRSP
jgi:NAD-dependent dihydropyrimidine dehydrogenase PreA subunit